MKAAKRFCALLLAACMAAFFGGCSDDSDNPSEKIISYNIESEPITLDPQIADDNAARLIILNIFEGLVRLDENDKPILGVAESYTVNDDCTEYTFTVRDDAKWNNGDNLTAEDFRYGIARALAPETGSQAVEKLYRIRNAEDFHNKKAKESELGISVSGNTITFELEHPDEDFLQVLTIPASMPCNKDFFNSTQGQYGRDDDMILSNGAFQIKSNGWSHDENIQLRVNTHYLGSKKPVPAGVDITIGKNPDNAYQAISDGTLDCYAIDSDDLERAKQVDMTVVSYDDITWGICFNVNNNVLSNVNIRKGFLTSLNRENIVKSIPEHYNNAIGIIPKSVTIGVSSYRDTAGAMFLKQSNDSNKYFSDGLEELETNELSGLEILCPDDKDIQPIINEILDSWNKATGYYFNKNPVSRTELSQALSNGSYAIAFAPLQSTGASPLDTLKQFRTNESGNIANLSSEDYDSLINKLESTSISDSIDTTIQAEKYLCDNAVFYPICTEARCYASASNASGIIFHQYGAEIDFRYATLLEKD